MLTKCGNCSVINPENMQFCGNCGYRLLSKESPTPALIIKSNIETTKTSDKKVVTDQTGQINQNELELKGQRRQVTVLFVDLSGYTHLSERIDGEELYDLVQQCSETFANDVYKYNGTVDKFTGDGLMALFGAPKAIENNAELAIRAALDMQTDLAELSERLKEKLGSEIKAHIGLNSGSVIVGGIGSNQAMNYTAIGNVVNLASRIESAATSGEILVSESVFRQVRNLFVFEALDPREMKGISDPVQTYRVLSAKTKLTSVRSIEGLHAPMIGRDDELEQLLQTVEITVKEKIGSFVAISGEAGIGKSRLISEFKAALVKFPVQLEEGSCLVYRKGISYWIFQDAILRLIDQDSENPSFEYQARLREYITRVLPERIDNILPYIEYMLSIPLSDPIAAQRIELLDADQLRQQIFLAVRDLLLADIQNLPVVMILEDLHWADDSSLELLNNLLDFLPRKPIVIVAVSRSFEEEKLAEIVQRATEKLHNRFAKIIIKSLSSDQSNRLISELISSKNIPENLHNQITQLSSGIPLYVEEILRMFMDRNLLHIEDGQWQFAGAIDLKEMGIPNTIEGLILSRFDHLEPVQRHLLKVACMIGRAFTRSLLEACLPKLNVNEITQSLNILLEREFILIDSSPAGEFIFKHVLVSDTIYCTLLKRERKELHGLVAITIEAVFADHIESQIDVLARHYFWSDYKDRALHYLILAGQKSARNYNPNQASKHFEDAITLLPYVSHTEQQIIQVFTGQGDALSEIGEFVASRAAYERALQAMVGTQTENAETACELQCKIGRTYHNQDDYDQALKCFDQANQILQQAGSDSPVGHSLILSGIGWVHFRRGKLEDAEKYFLQAQLLAENTSRIDIVSSIYNRLGGIYFHKNQLRAASDFVVKSLALRQKTGDWPGVSRDYLNLGVLCWKNGVWDEALLNFKRSIEYAASYADEKGIFDRNINLGLLQIDRGYTDEAQQYLEKALQQARLIGDNSYIAFANLILGKLHIALCAWDKALEYCLCSEELYINLDDEESLVDVYINLGAIQLGMHNLPSATRYAQMAIDLIKKSSSDDLTGEKGYSQRLIGDIALESGDYIQAQKFYQESDSMFSVMENKIERGRCLVCYSRLAESESKNDLAQSYRQQAKDLFEELGALLELKKLAAL